MKHACSLFGVMMVICFTAGCKCDSDLSTTDKSAPAKIEDTEGTVRAPDTFVVKLSTTKGDIIIDVHREWSPHGADRFFELVKGKYYTNVAFFRVVDGFMAQAGISGDPEVNSEWRQKGIPDDPVKQSNTRGMVSFAMSGRPNSRTTQFFINYSDNPQLDGLRFAPFGKVRDMAVANALHKEYGEGAPRGRGPNQARLQKDGNAYLEQEFPNLDYILKADILN